MTTWLAVAFKLISSCLTLVEPYITLTVAAEEDLDRDGLTEVTVTLKLTGLMPVGHAQCMADGIASEGFYSEPPP